MCQCIYIFIYTYVRTQVNKQTNRQTDKQTKKQRHKETKKQTGPKMNRSKSSTFLVVSYAGRDSKRHESSTRK